MVLLKRLLVLAVATMAGASVMWAYFVYAWPPDLPPGLSRQDAGIIQYGAALEASMLFCSAMGATGLAAGRFLLGAAEREEVQRGLDKRIWKPFLAFCGAIIILGRVTIVGKVGFRSTGDVAAIAWGLGMLLPFLVWWIRSKGHNSGT